MAEIREALALAFLKSELPTDEVCRAMSIIDAMLNRLKGHETDGPND